MAPARALLVGAGGMGRSWGALLRDHPSVELVGWIDIVSGVAEASAGQLGVGGIWTGTDLGEALRALSPDFLVDVTVPSAHHEVTIRALEAGVAVLGEKPLASTMEEARDLVRCSERTGTLFMVSQNRRYNAGLAAFANLVRGELGELSVLTASFYRGPHFGGFREEMASPLLVDMAIHTFDAARLVSGADPVSVLCQEWNPPWSWYRGAACACATFEMSDGSRFVYDGSWCAPGRPTSWESSWRAVGSAGSALWDGEGVPSAVVVAPSEAAPGARAPAAAVSSEQAGDRELRGVLDQDAPQGLAGSLADFLGALSKAATPMGECHDNLKSLAMVFGALESSASGRREHVSW